MNVHSDTTIREQQRGNGYTQANKKMKEKESPRTVLLLEQNKTEQKERDIRQISIRHVSFLIRIPGASMPGVTASDNKFMRKQYR